jgi:septal ring factor EnvC (AmiA/AmiB activator)
VKPDAKGAKTNDLSTRGKAGEAAPSRAPAAAAAAAAAASSSVEARTLAQRQLEATRGQLTMVKEQISSLQARRRELERKCEELEQTMKFLEGPAPDTAAADWSSSFPWDDEVCALEQVAASIFSDVQCG